MVNDPTLSRPPFENPMDANFYDMLGFDSKVSGWDEAPVSSGRNMDFGPATLPLAS